MGLGGSLRLKLSYLAVVEEAVDTIEGCARCDDRWCRGAEEGRKVSLGREKQSG